jgi:hypothetical protein
MKALRNSKCCSHAPGKNCCATESCLCFAKTYNVWLFFFFFSFVYIYKQCFVLHTFIFFPLRMLTPTLIIISLCSVAVYAATGKSCHDNRHINGCSVPWYMPSIYKDTFTPVCDTHDLCYYCVCIYFLYYVVRGSLKYREI